MGISELLMWFCHLDTLYRSLCCNLLIGSDLLMYSADAQWQETVCLCKSAVI